MEGSWRILEEIFEAIMEGILEGMLEGVLEGIFEGILEGMLDGILDGILVGILEGRDVLSSNFTRRRSVIMLAEFFHKKVLEGSLWGSA